MSQRISSVFPRSLADRHGIAAGETLISISGTPVLDLVDYQYLTARPVLDLLLEDVITKEDYRAAVREADAELQELDQRIRFLRRKVTDEDGASEHRTEIFEWIRTYLAQEKVTKELYSELLEKIVVYDDAHVDIYLQGMDAPFAVSYRRKGRGTEYTVFCEDYAGSQET